MAHDEDTDRSSRFLSDSLTKLGQRRHRSDTVSLRIDNRLKFALSQEAKKKKMNLNSLATQIFTSYIDWGRYSDELRLIPFNEDILKQIFQALSKESIEEISTKAGETVAHEEIVFLFKRVTTETLIRYIEVRSAHFSAYHHWYENGQHYFTLQHDLGQNFCLFIKGYLNAMVRSTIGGVVDFLEVSPNSITYRITH